MKFKKKLCVTDEYIILIITVLWALTLGRPAVHQQHQQNVLRRTRGQTQHLPSLSTALSFSPSQGMSNA